LSVTTGTAGTNGTNGTNGAPGSSSTTAKSVSTAGLTVSTQKVLATVSSLSIAAQRVSISQNFFAHTYVVYPWFSGSAHLET
jgi:hypothetical protein